MSGFEITDLDAVRAQDIEVIVEEQARLWLYRYIVHGQEGSRVVASSPNVYAARDIALNGGRALLNHLRKVAA